jgi:hypothetical protein
VMRASLATLLALAFLHPFPSGAASSGAVIVKVHNSLDIARPRETIVLKASDLKRLLGVDDVRRVHVQDQQSKQELLVQAIDDNDDGIFEELLFQTDVGPREGKSFRLTVGERQVPRREDFKAYGRFVRERRDDFAWENDRIAHRMYGAALETWAQEPLTSSAVDVWTKRVPRLVINDWYMVDDYHNDHGEGGDFYAAGSTRGCGGNGIWADGQLYPSANFRNSRVLANGPIRLIFELMYDAWDAHGTRVSEVKRITLDAGQNFNRFESHYTIEGGPHELTDAIGIRKITGSVVSVPSGSAWMRTWESLPKDAGQLGIAVIVDPATLLSSAEDKKNYLLLVKVPADSVVTYYAGFGWNKSGQFRTVEDWDRYVADFATRLRTPVSVTLARE